MGRPNTIGRHFRFKRAEIAVKNRKKSSCFLRIGGIGASRISSPRPSHLSDRLQNGSATPSSCSSPETALQVVLGTWLLHLDNASCASLSGQAQHPCSSPPALLIRSGSLRLSSVPGDKYHTKRGKDLKTLWR